MIPTIPAGWKLVPERATQAMEDAWDATPLNEDIDAEFHAAYAAMINAAPTPPASAQDDAKDEAQIARWKRDSELLMAIQDSCWDVRFLSHSNGDDYDISIEIVGHYMAAPHERVMGENHSENLRAALEQALTADAYPPARPEYDEWGRPVVRAASQQQEG